MYALLQISLADVALYTMLEFCQQCIEDSMSITPWVEQFVETFRNEEHIKMYLTDRPKSRVFGLWDSDVKKHPLLSDFAQSTFKISYSASNDMSTLCHAVPTLSNG